MDRPFILPRQARRLVPDSAAAPGPHRGSKAQAGARISNRVRKGLAAYLADKELTGPLKVDKPLVSTLRQLLEVLAAICNDLTPGATEEGTLATARRAWDNLASKLRAATDDAPGMPEVCLPLVCLLCVCVWGGGVWALSSRKQRCPFEWPLIAHPGDAACVGQVLAKAGTPGK